VSILAACCLAGLLLVAAPEPRHTIIGYSAQGRSIDAYAVGHGPHAVLILGGIHGGLESNTTWLVWELLAYFEVRPEAVPEQLTLLFVPVVNPDGLSTGTRGLANGVDPNRNWPTWDWVPDTFAPGGLMLFGGGGQLPLSEPETSVLAAWIDHVQQVTIISYHSAAGQVMGGPVANATGLLHAYLDATGYWGHDWIAYPVTGDFAQWSEGLGTPTIEVELTDHVDPEVERNLGGVLAVLDLLAALLPCDPSYLAC
jgi:protein MpaA